MFEKICTRLLCLYPSRFRKEYEGEALQLVQDRLRDEKGFFRRARLWLDLMMDLFIGLPQAYRNAYAEEKITSLSPNLEGLPSFKVLNAEPLSSGPILMGGTASLCAIVAFGFVMSHPPAYGPLSGSNKKISAIEAVIERVNKVTSPDSNIGAANGPANSSSADANAKQPTAVQTVSTSASKPEMPASLPQGNSKADGQRQAIPLGIQSPEGHFSYPSATASAGFPESAKHLEAGMSAHMLAQEPDKGCVAASQPQLKGLDEARLKPNSSRTTAAGDCFQRQDSAVSHTRHRVR